MNNVIAFVASLPPIAGAIQKHGEGGYRVILDVPESEREAIKQLLDVQETLLYVTIVPQE